MYIIISIFYISFAGMIIMLFLKHNEIMTGNPTIVSRMGRNADHAFHSIFSAIRRYASYVNKHTLVAIFHWIAFHILKRIRNVYVEIKHRFISTPHGKKLIDAVRGRGDIKDHGASFYLRRIADR